MFIETRFYNSGAAEAKMLKHRPVQDPDDHTGKYDFYVDEVETLEGWVETLEIEPDATPALVSALEAGGWVDITAYC